MVDVEALYRRYGPMVLRRCRRLLGDEEAARDVMHDVFVKLLDRADDVQDRGLSSLLFTMATHASLNRIRARKHGAERAVCAGDAVLAEIASLDDLAERSMWASLSRLVFAREPASTRVIAVMRYVDGMSWEEIAHATGLSVSGARHRLRQLSARALLLAGAEARARR